MHTAQTKQTTAFSHECKYYPVIQRWASQQPGRAEKSSGRRRDSSTSFSNAAGHQNRLWIWAANGFVVRSLTAQSLTMRQTRRTVTLYTAASRKRRNHSSHEQCFWNGNNHAAVMMGQGTRTHTHPEGSGICYYAYICSGSLWCSPGAHLLQWWCSRFSWFAATWR